MRILPNLNWVNKIDYQLPSRLEIIWFKFVVGLAGNFCCVTTWSFGLYITLIPKIDFERG